MLFTTGHVVVSYPSSGLLHTIIAYSTN